MNNNLDPETLKIPAYMRKKAIVSQAKQKLILTALDRKEAGLSVGSQKALSTPKRSGGAYPTKVLLSKTPPARPTPKINFASHSRLGRNLLPQQSFDKTFPCIGEVTHYLDKIGVAIIMLSAPLKENEMVLIQSEDSIFLQTVNEMQIDRNPVAKAKRGSHIGLKVDRPASINGKVYKSG